MPKYLSTDPNAGKETTPLSPPDELAFKRWVTASGIPDADAPDAHYDYRGLFKEVGGKPVPPSPDRHFPDTYKQHGHPTFSVESQYSSGPGDGGSWNGDQFVPSKYLSTDPNAGQPVSATAPQAPAKSMSNADILRSASGVKPVMTEGEIVNQPSFVNRLNATMAGPAHPTTAGDLLTSILPSTMGVGGARQVVGNAASSVASKVADVVPTRAGAGAKFQEVMGAAKNAPVDVEAPGQVALRIKDLADRGASMPLPVRKFLNRVTDPKLGQLTYEEARDFASNISRLSADEFNRLTPVVSREVQNLRVTLNGAIANTAELAGKGAEYYKAMSEYKNAMRMRGIWDALIEGGKKALPYVSAMGAGKYLTDKVVGAVSGKD